ncbi:MAG TPA: VOC family protein [Bryobacteraceae bacterium]|nr:VOC family protein [Bryobacteraceae bacterium]
MSDSITSGSAMPESWKLVGFIAVTDATHAREFYAGKLGLKLIEESPFALVFDCNGVMIRVTPVKELNAQRFTILGWQVSDIEQAVARLESAGVELKRYPGVPQDARGIWTAPGGAKIAWFEDPDGNTLSVSQH